MTWIAPKTNWTADDYFNVADWDRIRGNLEYLQDFVCKFYARFSISSTAEKTVESWLYASDLNAIENNLETINALSVQLGIGEKQVFAGGGHSIDYAELNRIESASLEIYNAARRLSDRYYFCDAETYADEDVGVL